ncbi:hypothetical protein NDU88_000838 [Pleurodeles waltl]|uniref:Uncharacterized protein n=1 Tax=Pleurodeles waltl TaxID=8319 RepID=A0AAV7V898_PLEWA|nr:hypothetical protein NDU88_000838 [Pleurodeles waltl]
MNPKAIFLQKADDALDPLPALISGRWESLPPAGQQQAAETVGARFPLAGEPQTAKNTNQLLRAQSKESAILGRVGPESSKDNLLVKVFIPLINA